MGDTARGEINQDEYVQKKTEILRRRSSSELPDRGIRFLNREILLSRIKTVPCLAFAPHLLNGPAIRYRWLARQHRPISPFNQSDCFGAHQIRLWTELRPHP